MDPQNVSSPSLVSGRQHLGGRALSLFISRHGRPAVVFFLIAILASYLAPAIQAPWASTTVLYLWAIFGVLFVYAFVAGWILYANYTYSIEEDAFRISKGVFFKRETAIPYRQIRDVNIERTLVQQMAGVSTLRVLTVGEEVSPGTRESVLPIVKNVRRKAAIALQIELLKRADVQKVIT